MELTKVPKGKDAEAARERSSVGQQFSSAAHGSFVERTTLLPQRETALHCFTV
jgi:hypothetical protein